MRENSDNGRFGYVLQGHDRLGLSEIISILETREKWGNLQSANFENVGVAKMNLKSHLEILRI